MPSKTSAAGAPTRASFMIFKALGPLSLRE